MSASFPSSWNTGPWLSVCSHSMHVLMTTVGVMFVQDMYIVVTPPRYIFIIIITVVVMFSRLDQEFPDVVRETNMREEECGYALGLMIDCTYN